MKKFNQIFFKGLIVVLPITLTFYLIIWSSLKIESLFGNIFTSIFGQEYYAPGIGILLTVLLTFFVGLLVSNYITGRVLKWFTNILEKLPLIKVIYNPLKDLMALIPGKSALSKDRPKRVVLVSLENGLSVLGLVTRESLDELGDDERITVYVPLSYILGGITLIVPKDKVTKVDIPVDQALKLSVTAWIKSEGIS